MRWLEDRQREALVRAVVVTFAAHALPYWAVHSLGFADLYYAASRSAWFTRLSSAIGASYGRAYEELWSIMGDSWCLLFGLMLVLPNPKKCGLRIGAIAENWRRVTLVIAVPSLIAACVAPFLELPKFAISLWLISPLAQDLVFSGYLYAILDDAFPGPVHPRVRIHRAVLLAACFFSLWHTPNCVYWNWQFVTLQLGYTFLGAVIVGMTRQWTGSLLYVTFAHTLGNFGAWCLTQSSHFPIRPWG
jgi:membrane protease YdiL (CAAX protease family)